MSVLETMNQFVGTGKFGKVFVKDEFLYATNGHVIVKSHPEKKTNLKSDLNPIDFDKVMAPREGREFQLEVPFLAYIEPQELHDSIIVTCEVGLMPDGRVTFWSSLNQAGKDESLVRINLGLLRPFEEQIVTLWIRGKTDSIYFECGSFVGSIMPMRPL